MRTDPKTGEDVLHFVTPPDGRGVRADPHVRPRLGHPAVNTDVAPSLLEFKPTMAGGDQVQR